MSDSRYFLHRYHNLVNSHRKPLRCRFCSEKFSARELESHFFDEHGYRFPNRDSCPWCVGNVSWKPRRKHKHARHLSDCFKSYGRQFEWTEPRPDERFDELPVCRAKEWYGRWMLFDLHPYAYESVFLPVAGDDVSTAWWSSNEEEEEDDSRLLRSADDSGIAHVRKFLRFEGSAVGWFHLIVRAHALGEFFERFEEYVDPADHAKRHGAFLLEFSCWCDGGERYDDPAHRHHRHMIAVARNGKDFYDRCWKRVAAAAEEMPPVSDYRYKACREIRTWSRLKETIFDLSSRRSKECEFAEKERSDRKTTGSCRFYVFRPVTPSFELRAAFDGVEGIRETITTLRGRKPVTPFALRCDRGSCSDSGAWRVKIGDVLDPHVEGILLRQVERDRTRLENRDAPNARFFGGGGGGRAFLESAKRDWWYPPENQQRTLDEVVPLVREMESLRFENTRLLLHCRNNERNHAIRLNAEKKRLQRQKAESERKESELEKESAVLKMDFEKLREKYDRLTDAFLKSTDEKFETVVHVLTDEIRRHREEIHRLRAESTQQRDMVVQLTNRLGERVKKTGESPPPGVQEKKEEEVTDGPHYTV